MMVRINLGGTRYYKNLQTSQLYISCTEFINRVTPTSPSLLSWFKNNSSEFTAKYSAERRALGTAMAVCLDRYITENSVDIDFIEIAIEQSLDEEGIQRPPTAAEFETVYKAILSWKQFEEDKSVTTIFSEKMVVHPNYPIAGTLDWFGELIFNRKKVLAVIDWKVGNIYPEHALQLQIYKECLEEQYGEEIMLFNWSPKDFRLKETGTTPTYDFKNQSNHAYDVDAAAAWAKCLGVLDMPTQLLKIDYKNISKNSIFEVKNIL